MADNISFEIKKHLGTIYTSRNGWRKEVNIVAWNGSKGKIDIRTWSPDHEHMTKGVTLTEKEAAKVAEILSSVL